MAVNALAGGAVLSLPSQPVKASSVDIKQRLPYNPHRTHPKKPQPPPDSLTSLFTTSTNRTDINMSDLLKRNTIANSTQAELAESTYMGYETWLPSPPRVDKPRSVLNAAALAYIGDCIYEVQSSGFETGELYARRHFLFPPLKIEEYNDRVMAVVRCETQDAMLQKLINDDCLSEGERTVLRWGKNIGSAKTRTKKRAGVAVYNRASSLETLIGYLYLTNAQRLEEIMMKLGFSTGASNQLILEELQSISNGR